MDYKIIDGNIFTQLLKSGFQNLSFYTQDINDLNVFPVPDGDTGINMKLTYSSGLEHINSSTKDISSISKDFAAGMLLGARGNSGVLTSRYFHGLSKGFENLNQVSVKDFANAMVEAYKAAYSAVDEPVEGTILTVAREGIDSISSSLNYDDISFANFFKAIVDAMRISLNNTPNLLPILKDAGVIDSGGKGLLTIFEGFLNFFTGKIVETNESINEGNSFASSLDFSLFNQDSVLEFGYCTEFLLQLQTCKIDIQNFDIKSFISFLHKNGESVVCFQNGSIVKVHIHTKTPYVIIQYAQEFGEFLTFKMENMTLQNKNVNEKKGKKKTLKKKYSIISVAQGDGIIETFKNLGCDKVINGGHTMNISTSELIDAFDEINSDEIILLPNEKNSLMVAHQAAKLYKDSNVRVIDTNTMQAGYACMCMIMGEEETAEECYQSMNEANKYVETGFICKCANNRIVDGINCIKDSYIFSHNSKLVGCKKDFLSAFKDLISHIDDIDERESMFIFYGKNIKSSEVEEISKFIHTNYPKIELGMYNGKQDIYDILLGFN